VQGGVQEDAVRSDHVADGHRKEFGTVRSFPFLFSNAKQADAMVVGPSARMLSAKLEVKGVIILGVLRSGIRKLSPNSKRPITKGEDLDGLKLPRDSESGCSW
jgi:TRAP-type C4-dicarboxylate transport system substrate-binding protein